MEITLQGLSALTMVIGMICLCLGSIQYVNAMRDPDLTAEWRSAAALLLPAGACLAISISLNFFQGLS